MSEPFDITLLEREAQQRTGLTDFGPGDWRKSLAALLDSADCEARLSDLGRQLLCLQLVDRLVNRLEIQDWVTRHPEVHTERVEAPLILATLPRTGQTAMGWILDRDPANRALTAWFARRPCPPPLPGNNEGDPRLDTARAMVAAMPPEILDLHLYDAEEPDECHWLISNALKTPHEIYSMQVPSYYRSARDDPGMLATYEYFLLQLKLLQSRTPGRRWVLKNSPHLLYLDSLHAVLPDAIFVQFHRDPLKVLASNCRLCLLLRGMASDAVDPHEVGASMLQLLGDYVNGLLRFRARGVSRPWIDIHFSDFVKDPLAAAAHLYGAAELPLSSLARERMTQWVKAHPREDLRRAQPPDLSPYGIDPADARAVFAEYCETFQVPNDGI